MTDELIDRGHRLVFARLSGHTGGESPGSGTRTLLTGIRVSIAVGAHFGFLGQGRIAAYLRKEPMSTPHLDLDLGNDQDQEPDLEIVDELVFDAVDEGVDDAYSIFVAALTDVALGFGADPVGVDRLRGMLGQTRVDGLLADEGARAWQGVIRGESEDFSRCGSATLDEWAAGVVARVVGSGCSRTDAIRRELRRRGVAAFGFMAEAA